jgi:hypothetical protein
VMRSGSPLEFMGVAVVGDELRFYHPPAASWYASEPNGEHITCTAKCW